MPLTSRSSGGSDGDLSRHHLRPPPAAGPTADHAEVAVGPRLVDVAEAKEAKLTLIPGQEVVRRPARRPPP